MDYKQLGLQVGLEIHQQLAGRKLFCSCPALLREDVPHFTIRRKLRAAAGEQGETDTAARQEQQRDRTFTYEGYQDTTCLVEVDEEPPLPLNPEALRTTIQFSSLVQAQLVPILQVMRKIVVDGSNTSGFQRTMLVGMNGFIGSSAGKVKITGINLEEDACRNIQETGEERTYRLDRLGIPLIEIGTAPDIHTPEQCQEVAKKLGWLLRSLPFVKRGLGTIRQDVNISIAGGNRIEIKGAQDLKMLPAMVQYEVQRQQVLLRIKEELRGTRLIPLEIIELSVLMNNCPSPVIQRAFQKGGKVLGMRLNNFAGRLKQELQPNVRLGTEFSGRAKVIAGVGGIFHSDELPNYGITDLAPLRKKLKCAENDAFILVADEEQKARWALAAVYARAEETLRGVPLEVRKAEPDGTSSYVRPIPGAARMYPETDIHLMVLSSEKISLPETIEQKIERYQKQFHLSADLATFAALSDRLFLFEELVKKYPNIKPAFIAETLVSTPLDIKRQYNEDPEKLRDEHFRELFAALAAGKIHKDIVLDVLIDMIKGQFSVERYAGLGTEQIHQVLQEILQKNPDAPFSALMGQAMKQLAGKASGKFIAEELQKMVEIKMHQVA